MFRQEFYFPHQISDEAIPALLQTSLPNGQLHYYDIWYEHRVTMYNYSNDILSTSKLHTRSSLLILDKAKTAMFLHTHIMFLVHSYTGGNRIKAFHNSGKLSSTRLLGSSFTNYALDLYSLSPSRSSPCCTVSSRRPCSAREARVRASQLGANSSSRARPCLTVAHWSLAEQCRQARGHTHVHVASQVS